MKLQGIPRATSLPRLARIKQQFAGPMLHDIPQAVRQTLGRLALPITAGQTVALAVGSRGIVNLDVIAKACVDHVKALGAHPFLTLTLFIAMFERDHDEPLGFQLEYARRVSHMSLPYPDIAT